LRIGDYGRLYAKLFLDQSHERVSYLDVPGNGRLSASPGMGVDVMLLAMALQIAATLDEVFDERTSLHTSTPTSVLCVPARFSSVSYSANIMR
jgi:hypothetical protein